MSSHSLSVMLCLWVSLRIGLSAPAKAKQHEFVSEWPLSNRKHGPVGARLSFRPSYNACCNDVEAHTRSCIHGAGINTGLLQARLKQIYVWLTLWPRWRIPATFGIRTMWTLFAYGGFLVSEIIALTSNWTKQKVIHKSKGNILTDVTELNN